MNKLFDRLLLRAAIFFLLLSPFSGIASADTAGNPVPFSVPILLYHRFGPVVADGMTVTTAVFESHLKYLKENGYQVIPLKQLVDYYLNKSPKPLPKSVVIVVDDGHESVYQHMLPLVKEFHVPVTLFLYPSAISNASYAMTWDQLRDLKKTGLFDFQGHTYWHPNFKHDEKRMSPSEYEKSVDLQLTKSKAKLEKELGVRVDMLAWPFGIYNDRLLEKAKEAGYIATFSIEARPTTDGDSVMKLPRYLLTNAVSGKAFERIVEGNAGKVHVGLLKQFCRQCTVGEGKMNTKRARLVMTCCVLFIFSLANATKGRTANGEAGGTVLDADTGKPIKAAMVTVGNKITLTDENGMFAIEGEADSIGFRAHGYGRTTMPVPESSRTPLEVRLKPFLPKALYLTNYGIADRSLRGNALRLITETELNALVIDVKGDRGVITYKSDIPLATEIGAQKLVIVKDIKGLLASLKERGIYTIARIVVFKDTVLGAARPDLAIKTRSGELWRDREGLIWVDPSKQEVWEYNIAIAEEAARNGFDEIQFDYVRFPDQKGPTFSVANTEPNRVAAISGFLDEAHRRLVPYNVFLSADVFGYVAWNLNDTAIGQRLDSMAATVDYLALMLYPSGFQFGIPGCTNPVEHSHEIVARSLERARQRTGIPAVRFRPWLQGFKDYAFDKRYFLGPEIRTQIDAAESFGAGGWMLWNPRNVYMAEGLKSAPGEIIMSKAGIGENTSAVEHPVEIVPPAAAKTQRSGSAAVRFEPPVEGFSDYAFGRKEFPTPEKRARVSFSKDSVATVLLPGKPSDVYLSQGLN